MNKKRRITPKDLLSCKVTKKDFQGIHIKRIKDIKKAHLALVKVLKKSWAETLKEICNKKMNKEEKKQLRKYKKDWKELKTRLAFLDFNIKKETIVLLDGIFLLVNHHDDKENYELNKAINMGFTIKEGFYRNPDPYELDVFVQRSIFEVIHLFDNLILLAIEIYDFTQGALDYYNIDKTKFSGICDILKRLESISIAQAKHDDRSIRAHRRLNDIIAAKNKDDNHKRITQKECAGILYRAEETFVDSAARYINKHHLKINSPKVPKEESLVRRVQRWDHYNITKKGAPPPDGYSRNKSYKDFVYWAKLYIDDKYNRWIAAHPIIRTIPNQ